MKDLIGKYEIGKKNKLRWKGFTVNYVAGKTNFQRSHQIIEKFLLEQRLTWTKKRN